MKQIGRNGPCPCGSGKKYKKCCLLKKEEIEAGHREESGAPSRALDWLAERYPEEVNAAIDDEFYGALTDDELDLLEDLPADLRQMVHINMGEWLVTDAHLELNGVRTPVREVLLGLGGPLLSPVRRDWLQRLGERALGLYEVKEVKPGEGMELANLLQPDEPAVWVTERAASRTLVRYDIFGARLARCDSGFVLSGAVYPFVREEALSCREEILHEMEGGTWGSDLAREVVGSIIIDYWLEGLVAERPLPKLVDTSTGDPVMLVTDHYEVTDWDTLGVILAAQQDVHGDRKEGWVRFSATEGNMRRSRAALNPQSEGTLEVFCRTVKLADDSRQWLEQIAGSTLTFKIREMVDPRSPKALQSAPAAPKSDIPPEIAGEIIRDYMRNHYANWTDEPIPALGNKTPRAAIKTEKGRRQVVELLKSYEHSEARRVRDQRGKPFDFGFLWNGLGLKPE